MAHDFEKFPELTNAQMQLYYFESPHKQITEDFTAEVVEVHDGDTITLLWQERDFNFPLRFKDTNAPELNEDGGEESRKWLEGIILKETIDILIDAKNRVDKWGRLLGIVVHGGININEESVRTGHATPFANREEGKVPRLDQWLA